jgi:hypothetical protein
MLIITLPCFFQWGKTVSLNSSHQWVYFSSLRWYMSMASLIASTESHGGMILTGRPKNLEKILCQYHFVHQSPLWTYLDSNSGLCGEGPAPNCLSHSLAFHASLVGVIITGLVHFTLVHFKLYIN